MTFDDMRTRYALLYHSVKELHANAPTHRGHGLDHDVTVAQYALMIAPDERTGQKAWCAALLHSLDRLLPKDHVYSGTRQRAKLVSDYFDRDELNEIAEAALRHSELNQDDQSLTQVTLMDADRLANLNALVIIRSGQFRPDIPAIELEHVNATNPTSTYRDPKSILDDLRISIEQYTPQFRLQRAVGLASAYVSHLETFFRWVGADHKMLGLDGVQL